MLLTSRCMRDTKIQRIQHVYSASLSNSSRSLIFHTVVVANAIFGRFHTHVGRSSDKPLIIVLSGIVPIEGPRTIARESVTNYEISSPSGSFCSGNKKQKEEEALCEFTKKRPIGPRQQ